MFESNVDWAQNIHDQLLRENTGGGDLVDLPCPFCHRPRSQRSDYIRCNPCGVNWLNGEGLDNDPRIERKANQFPKLQPDPNR